MTPGATSGWTVDRQAGSGADLHGRDLEIAAGGRRVVVLEVDRPALVLGSTQSPDDVDQAMAAAQGIEVVSRRSGGGAVLLVPGEHVWVDVVITRDDPLWIDDVSASTAWLGRAWAAAVVELVDGPVAVHAGPMRRTALSDLVCFAGLAPGEVTVGGAKAVGVSQRRTRRWARFQCVAYRRWDPAILLDLVGVKGAVAAELDVARIDAPADDIVAALVCHLPE